MDKQPRIDYPVYNSWEDTLPEPLIDNAGGGVTYKGYSDYGVGDSEPKFMIVRITVAGNITRTEYAGGRKGLFAYSWTDRATATYTR